MRIDRGNALSAEVIRNITNTFLNQLGGSDGTEESRRTLVPFCYVTGSLVHQFTKRPTYLQYGPQASSIYLTKMWRCAEKYKFHR